MLSKEFISRFKTEADVSKFQKQLHDQVLEKMLEGEMDAIGGMKRTPWPVITVVIHATEAIRRKFMPNNENRHFYFT